MKKNLMALMVLLLAVAVAMPAFAEVQFKYGGQFRARYVANNDFDGVSTDVFGDVKNDNRNYFDQRLRMYFYFVASENLRVVTKFEVGDTTWGGDSSRIGPGTGGNEGADAVNIETKNAYVEFAIPTTPVKVSAGIQGIALLDSWIIDDDFSALTAKAKFDPFTVQMGYIAAQNSDITTAKDNIDSWFLSLDYNQGPWGASLVGYYQNGNRTLVSADPTTLSNPVSSPIAPVWFAATPLDTFGVDSNNLFDIGGKVTYKIDWLSAYVSFVKNLGSIDFVDRFNGLNNDQSFDYTGWMVDAGVSYFCGPFTFNLGGFYTSGQDPTKEGDSDIERFTYPLSTTKYFSELIGGGILDREGPIGHTGFTGKVDYQWTGYGQPSNLWTVTVGGAWQALEQTKLSAAYWYFGTAEDVVSGFNTTTGEIKFDSSVGHEFDMYLTQGIVDGLTLDIVGAILLTGDAYSAVNSDVNPWEVGARLQWNF